MTKLIITPPKLEKKSYKKPLMCGPGPCDISDEVKAALMLPVVSIMCPATYEMFDEIREGLKYCFQTKSHLVLAVSGAGHAAMETVISNLVGRGQTILFAHRGKWDERAEIMAQRYGINQVVVKCPPNRTLSHEEIETALKQHRPEALFVVHGDSSTGTCQEIKGLGQICRKYGTLLIIDTVVSLCSVPFHMDEWEVDAVYTSLQKGMGGPAGISPIAFGPRAEAVINNRTFEPPYYFDIKPLADQWNCYNKNIFYHHTMSPPLFHALRTCIREVCEETLPVRWARHLTAFKRLSEGLEKIKGVEFFVPNPADRLAAVTTISFTTGIDYAAAIEYIRERHNICLNGGTGPTVGKVLRVGLLAINATEEVADKLVFALDDTIKHFSNSKL